MRSFFRGGRAAVTLLTRVPVGGFPYGEADFAWAPAWFPLVGLAVAGVAAGAHALAWRAGLGPWLAALAAVTVEVVVTGALHEDGLADTADALGAGGDRERLFAILKDSRIGTYGACALVLALLVRVAALERLGSAAPSALMAAGGASRLAPVLLMASLPYVTPTEVARHAALARAHLPAAALAFLGHAAGLAALYRAGFVALPAAAAATGAALFVAAFARPLFRARAGGVTGDFLGAAQQVSACAALVAIVGLKG